ncbi:hypothetical protein [Streptomyces sp. NPDC002265]|uniref:hypothetical protein n=1 Tax=Streptomyces sp. NPDC002265 TaxID=3154415 RepID=UPI00331BB269
MSVASESPARPFAALQFLEPEITDRRWLTFPKLCYAKAGPAEGHDSTSTEGWTSVISAAATVGVDKVQLVKSEPGFCLGLEGVANRSGAPRGVHAGLWRVTHRHSRLAWDIYDVVVGTTVQALLPATGKGAA